MLKKIKLLGHLGRKFGKEYRFDVASPAEAVKALCHQVKGFKQYMLDGNGREQKFKIVVGKEVLEDIENQFKLQTEQSISIIPAVRGGGGSLGQVILGGILVASSLGFGPLGGLFVGEFAAFSGIATAATAVGAGLMIGGLANMLFKPPTLAVPQEKDRDNDRSYLFNGAVNTTQQGQPIPIGYGRMRIGSQVISASLSATQIAI